MEAGNEARHFADVVDDMGREELPFPPESPPVDGAAITSLRDVKLQRLARRVGETVVEVFGSPLHGDACEAAEAMLHAATMLEMKAARIGMYLSSGSPRGWADDGEPNLLLMPRLREQLDESLAKLRPKLDAAFVQAIEDSRDALFEVVDPMLDDVSVRSRKLVVSLITRNDAPSPFCTIGDAGF